MNAVIIAIMVLLGVFVIFAFCKIARINNRIDDIYNKAFTMQGEIEANTARAKDNYKLIAQVNTELESVKNSIALHKHEPTDEPAKEVEEELESLIPEQEEEVEPSNAAYELSVRRENYANFRKQGMDVKNAGKAVGVSYTTAKRYEQWRKDNKK
jgi:hypothetical protein